jgi:hypothetical protein
VVSLEDGLSRTFRWIEEQVRRGEKVEIAASTAS